MVHVAAAGENRGRVLLRLASAAPNRIAVEAALRVARAYQASLESLFVEDQHLIDVAAHADARELSLCGRHVRPLSVAGFLRQFTYTAREAERGIAGMARLADIPYRARTLRDTPLHAINRACAEAGPWNVVVFADPIRARDRGAMLDLMRETTGVTGFVLVAEPACRAHGPIVIVLEDIDRLAALLRIAERLAADTGEAVVLLLATTAEAGGGLENGARLLLAGRRDVVVRTADPETASLAEAVRRLKGGFVVGQMGGLLLPDDRSWGPLAQTLECPLFVVR